MHWADFFNSGASLFIVATASTKTMVPLRILAIVANCFLLTFYAGSHSWLPMTLQAFALPLNAFRLYQMVVLIRNVREAIRGKPSLDWLKPFMTERHCGKGDILFAKGEPADEMFCAVTGRYVLTELGIEIEAGQVVGELALLAPDDRRTATLDARRGRRSGVDHLRQVEQLLFRIRTFGFCFLGLQQRQLFDDIGRLKAL